MAAAVHLQLEEQMRVAELQDPPVAFGELYDFHSTGISHALIACTRIMPQCIFRSEGKSRILARFINRISLPIPNLHFVGQERMRSRCRSTQ